MYIKNNKGQSTVEYILLVTAVVAVMIVFATNKNGGFQTQLNTTLNTVTGDMSTGSTALSESHQPGNASSAGNGTSPDYNLAIAPNGT